MNSSTSATAARFVSPRQRPPILAGLLLMLLSGCAASTAILSRIPRPGAPPAKAAPANSLVPPAKGPTLPEPEAALARGDALAAAGLYQQAAVTASPKLAAEYRLRAAEAANAGNDPTRADQILDQIPASPLDERQQTRYRLLRAQTALARNDPARALRLLPVGDPGGEPALAERQLLTRARALSRSGDALGATQSLVQRERYLDSSTTMLAENRETIWSELSRATLDPATLGRATSAAPVTRGWVELAALARRKASLQEYEIWRKRYPGHPGEERLATLYVPADGTPPSALPDPATDIASIPITDGSFDALAARGSKAALLLPQTGPLTAIGESVHAGFVRTTSDTPARESRSYDSTGGSISVVFQQAILDGAGYVVGPLRREDVTTLAQAGALPAPVLALNYLDAGQTAPAGFYQFGLSPEDEARAAAEDAASRGLRRALAMVPATEWGNRILAAFEQRMQDLGGRVVDIGHYSGDPQDWAEPVRKLLRYVAIDDKKKAAAARAKVGPSIDPQRRNDFDYVFVAGRAAQARVLWPLFRYYHADRTPIYATSAVYEGDGESDLSGIRFCDAPWVLDVGGPWAALRGEALNGRNFDNARLFALGNDAAMLAGRIAQNQLHPGDVLPGATGTLKVDGSGAVRRSLVCAQMTSGSPFVLAPPDTVP